MKKRGRRDQSGVGYAAIDAVGGCKDGRNVVQPGKSCGAGAIRVNERRDGHALVPGQHGQVKVLGDGTTSDDSDPYRFLARQR